MLAVIRAIPVAFMMLLFAAVLTLVPRTAHAASCYNAATIRSHIAASTTVLSA